MPNKRMSVPFSEWVSLVFSATFILRSVTFIYLQQCVPN
jgi:hypothetical protein